MTLSGAATLSWEGIWQIKASLALGMSAHGTAITLAVTMGGMGFGSLWMGHALKHLQAIKPLRLYGLLEVMIGLSGLLLGPAFAVVEMLDSRIYLISPALAPLTHIISIFTVLGVPALCMGATFPVISLIAQQYHIKLTKLYGLNTLGAALGILLATFMLIPAWGLTHTGYIIAGANFIICAFSFALSTRRPLPMTEQVTELATTTAPASRSDFSYGLDLLARAGRTLAGDKEGYGHTASAALTGRQLLIVAALSGFMIFALEIAWFRALTAAFQSTTYAFAIMLSCVLVALSQGAHLTAFLKDKNFHLGTIMACAGILVLLATPLVERFDLFLMPTHSLDQTLRAQTTSDMLHGSGYLFQISLMMSFLFVLTYLVIGPAMILMGVCFPWLIFSEQSPRTLGRLYAANTLAAIAGSIGAAWILLPLIGFASTAWLVGSLSIVAGLWLMPRAPGQGRLLHRRQMIWGAFGVLALLVAATLNSGSGKTRALGAHYYAVDEHPQLVESYEGPNSTVSVVKHGQGEMRLIIDGMSASAQAGGDADSQAATHYLDWMGALPMLAHSDPRTALVICFGTGRTANALRREGIDSLDIVDIDRQVFNFAHYFPVNEAILEDQRVRPIVMDGRAYLRRTAQMYDVITLEPMPPNAAGVNALYTREFYQLAKARLQPGGVIAQWLPYSSMTPYYASSIARTFAAVFPNAILWVDPAAPEGILIGSHETDPEDVAALAQSWPGLQRQAVSRNLTPAQIRKAVRLDAGGLQRYGTNGDIISDDNQLLSYGRNAGALYTNVDHVQQNLDLLDSMGRP